MKKLIILILVAFSSYATYAQCEKTCVKICDRPCDKPCDRPCDKPCDKTACRMEGASKAEAAAITTMRNDLQTVITKMSKSSLTIDRQLKDMTIEKGASDDESLLYISQAAASIRYELLRRIEPAQLVASLKDYKHSASLTNQQTVADLKEEIQLLAAQAEKL
jgi:hypothetical protein